MSFFDDIQEDIGKGREFYKKTTKKNPQQQKRKKTTFINTIFIGMGTILEQILPSKEKIESTESRIPVKKKSEFAENCKKIIAEDVEAILEKLSSLIPKKKEKYDPGYEAWKRNRNLK